MCGGVATDVVESLSCSTCNVTVSDVDQLAEHSALQCVSSEVDGGRYSSDLADVDDRVVCAASPCSAPARDVDDRGVESTMKPSSVNDASHEVDAELNAAVDDFTRPHLPQCSTRRSPSFNLDIDHDDKHFDASNAYILPNISPSQNAVQFDKVYTAEVDAPATVRQRFPVVEGRATDDGGPSPRTSSSTVTNVSQLIDNNVSPASKIAMLESVVYALHQQQMFQLELIEALRRQLATALAASSSSRSADDGANATLDLTLPRSSESTVLDQGSSLTSLMRLSAGVDARRALPAGIQSPSTSPTTLSGSMSDSHDAAMSTGWPSELPLNKSRSAAESLPSALLSTPKHGAPLSDLSLFKKCK